jgi:hypothetical protein
LTDPPDGFGILNGLLPVLQDDLAGYACGVLEEQRAECNRLADRIEAVVWRLKFVLLAKLGKQIDYVRVRDHNVMFINRKRK